MSWRRLDSRVAEPTAPRKYLLVTMLVALIDQVDGNSTPRCSKLTVPSRQFVITTSRRSHVTSSYGCTPAVVWMRSTVRPVVPACLAGAFRRPDAPGVVEPTVSVMEILSSGAGGLGPATPQCSGAGRCS